MHTRYMLPGVVAWTEFWRRHGSVRELQALNDYQLADIGITRTHIETRFGAINVSGGYPV